MKILAIETSCDETSAAVLEEKQEGQVAVLSNIVSSQIKIHQKWGGVVPNLAAREHLKNCLPVIETALKESNTKLSGIDLFAVTQGPGLIPALLIGTNFAKTLSYVNEKPLLGIHHIEGHVAANLVSGDLKFPALALVVSGGHTQLIFMKEMFDYEIVGQTGDDAAGEAFDKVAKMLELGYPGGPIVSQRAEDFEKNLSKLQGKKLKEELSAISFPRPMLSKNNLDFSFSGLKTSVLYFIKELQKKNLDKDVYELYKDAICHEFQEAVIEVLVKKSMKAVKNFSPQTLLVCGGVAANKKLVASLKEAAEKVENLNFLSPKLEYCGDNAAMIGIAAYYRYRELEKAGRLDELKNNWKTLEAEANLKLQNL